MSDMKIFACILTCWSLLLPLQLFAQTPAQDSLLRLINTAEEDSLKARLMVDLALTYRRADTRKQHQYAKEALDLLALSDQHRLKVIALHTLGDSYLIMDVSSDSALVYFEQGLTLAQDIGFAAKEADFWNSIGAFYHQTGVHDKAFENYQQAITIAEREGLQEELCRYQNNIGLILMREGEYDRALSYFEKALATAEELDNKLIISALLSNMGIIHSERGQYDQALEKYTHSLDVRRGNNDKVGEALTTCNIGNMYRHKGWFELALSYQKQGLEIAEAIDFVRGQTVCLEGLTYTYFDAEQYEESIRYAERGPGDQRAPGIAGKHRGLQRPSGSQPCCTG